MRGLNDMVRQMRDIITNLDELKGKQNVGTNQIVAKPYSTAAAYDLQFNVVAPFQSQGSSFKTLRIDVIPSNMPAGNILISDVVPDLRLLNGSRVSQWNFSNNTVNYTTYYFITRITNADTTKNSYFVGIVAPTNTTMRIKVQVVANSDVTFTITEVN